MLPLMNVYAGADVVSEYRTGQPAPLCSISFVFKRSSLLLFSIVKMLCFDRFIEAELFKCFEVVCVAFQLLTEYHFRISCF